MAEARGLSRVLELVGPSIRAANAAGSLTPNSYSTPLAVASYALEHPFLVAVTATSTEAEQLRDAVAALLGPDVEVVLWPGWDTHPLERVSPDSAVMAARSLLRWRLSRGDEPRVVVASARSISQVLAPEQLRAPLMVRRGDQLDRDEFIGQLVATGYRRESLVEHRAEFAVRGGIVDVWPAQGDQPIRLDFFGDEVERLTSFDIANQRSLFDLEDVVIAPAREWIPDTAARDWADELVESAPWGRSSFDRLAAGHVFDGMEGWMPLFITRPRTLLDELGNVSCVVVEPERVRRRLEELLDEERELTDAVAATWQATTEIPLLHASWDDVLDGRVTVSLEAAPGALGSSSFSISSPPVVQGDPSDRSARAVVVDHAARRRSDEQRRGGRAHGRPVARRRARRHDRS